MDIYVKCPEHGYKSVESFIKGSIPSCPTCDTHAPIVETNYEADGEYITVTPVSEASATQVWRLGEFLKSNN